LGRILFVYNSASIEEKAQNFALGECATAVTIGEIYETLLKTGREVIPLNLADPQQLEQLIAGHQVDMAFVIAEGFIDVPFTMFDGSGAMTIREILRDHGVPYTHSCPEVMKILRNKDCTHTVLSAAGIKVPSFAVVDGEEDVEAFAGKLERDMPYPLFVKPAGGGSSICIDNFSVVYNQKELVERVGMIRKLLGSQPILVETYLPGREYTVGVFGNRERFVLPVIGFAPEGGVRSPAEKGLLRPTNVDMEILPDTHPIAMSLTGLALKAFEVLGAQDIIRIDVKEDVNGVCHVIDVNGTPSLGANGSIAAMAAAGGITIQEMVALILYEAMCRENCPVTSQFADMVAEPLSKLRALNGPKVA